MDINRRDFLGLGSAFAATPLFAALAADAAAVPASVSDALYAKMKLTTYKVKAGAKVPFSIVQASDTHWTFVSAADMERLDEKTIEWQASRSKIFAGGVLGLGAALLYAKRNNLPFFHTGDLFDFPSRGNMEALKRDFAGRDWFFSCGNHEYHGWGPGSPAIVHGSSKEDRENARKAVQGLYPNEIPVSSRVINGVNFVQYDNGGFSDYLGDWQFGQVKKEFAKGLPVVLLCHMPFYSDAVADMIVRTHGAGMTKDRIDGGYVQGRPDKPNWSGRLAMAEWLRKQPLLKAVICGHLHNEFVDDFTPTVKQYIAAANYNGAVYRFDFT